MRIYVLLFTVVILAGFFEPTIAQQEESSNPFSLSVTYTVDIFGNFNGGNATGLRYMDNLDVNLEAHFETLPFGLGGTTFYVYGLGNQGSGISALTGDIQGVSNIETENSWRIFEAWVQKKFFLANSSLLVGLYDINSEFNVLNSSLLFLNSSHGLDPTIASSGVMGPSTFPYTSLAARLKINPFSGMVIQGAVLDGVPSDPANSKGTKVKLRKSNGVFVIGEVGYHSVSGMELQQRNRTSRRQNLLAPGISSDNSIALGGWFYSDKRDTFTDGYQQTEFGIYALGEYEILTESEGEQIPESLQIFGRAGISNTEVQEIGGFFGAGFVVKGLFKQRSKDQSGFAVAWASAGTEYINNTFIGDGRPEKAETNFELTHLFSLNDYADLQLNTQYILNPGFNPVLDNAMVGGLRLILGF
tara:strand:+ start:129110 stop:130357 length:1248 start_codon:yes stop_codon:yes gene_type:complete